VCYSTYPLLLLATPIATHAKRLDDEDTLPPLDDTIATTLQTILELAQAFRVKAIDAPTTHLFENQLQQQLRELGRIIAQWVYNTVESPVDQLPKHLRFQNNCYTRLNRKTPQNVWTLFGQIKLWRVGYRPTDKIPEPTIFPLPMTLGLIRGASPALAERAGLFLAEAGMTQERTLECLRRDHTVGWPDPAELVEPPVGARHLGRRWGPFVPRLRSSTRRDIRSGHLLQSRDRACEGSGRELEIVP
jgi:hypothetical protein